MKMKMNERPPSKYLLIAGNSNVGKSSITRLLLPNPKLYKGKIGKSPGSTLLIKPISQQNLPYQIIDLPGFGYTSHSSRRRAEHIKKQIVVHIEKYSSKYFFGLVILNILRIEDEINKYYIQRKHTIPLSFELINFLREFAIPLLLILNKIDKISNFDRKRIITVLTESAKEYELDLIHLNDLIDGNKANIPYLEFSALKKVNLEKLKKEIQNKLKNAI
jgi:GTP-binding protein EngB required for normal cell division